MARRSEYLDWLIEQLAPLGTIPAKAMFGGYVAGSSLMVSMFSKEHPLNLCMYDNGNHLVAPAYKISRVRGLLGQNSIGVNTAPNHSKFDPCI